MSSRVDLRRRVPSVDEVLRDPALRPLEERHGRGAVLQAIRVLLDGARRHAAAGDEAGLDAALASPATSLRERLEAAARPSLIRVINATGVVIHTNLGRAPLPPEALDRVAEIARGYSNLEYDVAAGERGQREVHAESRILALTGAEAAAVVNNNAAAVLLAVNTLAEGREVLVSRGELVEIGGSFRIPDVLRKGGARLREVGTTNRTRLEDYRSAIGPETGMLLKVHPSNFRILGFTQSATVEELASLAREARLPLVEDMGSGALSPPGTLRGEPSVRASLEAGADLVTFSGDKLLGGPQAGLAVGRRGLVDRLRRNPLYRALRVDKMTLAALDAVLALHESGRAGEEIPVLRMLGRHVEDLRARAGALVGRLRAAHPDASFEVKDGVSAVGGGAAPATELPTALVTVAHAALGADSLAARLREASPPVIARVADGRVVLDLRTVEPEEEQALQDAVSRAMA
jgi:L-seryl-tRNA(Ser) seleniumtransferase